MTEPNRAGSGGPSGGFEMVVVIAGVGLIGAAATTAGGAWVAALLAGGRVSGGLDVWLTAARKLAADPSSPGAAWGSQATGLPGPGLYWACTIVVLLFVVAVASTSVWAWRRVTKPSRIRFGVETEARVARRRDVLPLVIPTAVPTTGRLLLGQQARRGPLLATEDRERQGPLGRKARLHQGDRGSVALIGPTRAGKTVLASAGIIGWDGPVVALSVKRDLYDVTAAARAERGELAVFDPSGVTGLASARWTPLRDVTTTSGAARAGRALAQAIPRNGVTGGDFWASHGETLTSAYMSLAGLTQLLPGTNDKPRQPLTIGRLASWAYLHIGITDPTVNELVVCGLAAKQPLEVRLLAKGAMTKLMAFEGEDPRIRASIYATARLAFEAWTEPSVAHSASLDPRSTYSSDEIWEHEPRYVDLEWLMDGGKERSNTLYLSAPSTEFARLAPVLGGLLGDLREQIHTWDIAGRKLDKPLLIVIDEAGQLELQWLPEEVSTIAGLGGIFLTSWQSKAQITHRYGTLADAVLGGHRSKIIFNGTDDPATLDYANRIAGTIHVPQRGWSAASDGARKTVSEQPQREDLLPAHLIRQMRRQEAVLFHGTLPPIHLRLVRWWENDELSALMPVGDDGKPKGPPVNSTCPVSSTRTTSPEPVLDESAVAEMITNLPQVHAPRTLLTPVTASQPVPARGDDRSQPQLTFPDEPTQSARNRVAGKCEKCDGDVPVGAGTATTYGTRAIVVCYPKCP